MVSLRCKNLVIETLEQLAIPYNFVDLGFADLSNVLSEASLKLLNTNLKMSGLEILDNHNAIIIEQIKNIIVELVYSNEFTPLENLSNYIANKLKLDYGYLTNLFTKVKGETIQQYFIKHKIERAKELIFYDEKTLTEIADCLHYSSIAHFSNQFKKVTGLAPSVFKKMKIERKINIENL
jgi:YesN/AraC family two-component response regulator